MDAFFEDTPVASPDDLFSIFDGLDHDFPPFTPILDQSTPKSCSSNSHPLQDLSETELEGSPKRKRAKVEDSDGQQKVSHIAVERNRRKQMNQHLSVLRSLMPCFYVKRGDQASIIGGVVDYINELQQILQSLEAKKQRKVYSEVLSPRVVSSPRPSPLSPRKPSLSPRKPPLSPRLNLPISPRTPQPSSPYKPRLHHLSSTATSSLEQSLSSSPSNSSAVELISNVNELVASSKSFLADVEVKFSGPNVLLKTVSPRIPGQAFKIISALEGLSLEILHVNISTVEETMLVNSFTIKIGIECQLSAQELAQQIQQTFC